MYKRTYNEEKREKKTSNMPVSLLFVHVRACVYMCDIGKIRVVYQTREREREKKKD